MDDAVPILMFHFFPVFFLLPAAFSVVVVVVKK
jgi:hypothetical protein